MTTQAKQTPSLSISNASFDTKQKQLLSEASRLLQQHFDKLLSNDAYFDSALNEFNGIQSTVNFLYGTDSKLYIELSHLYDNYSEQYDLKLEEKRLELEAHIIKHSGESAQPVPASDNSDYSPVLRGQAPTVCIYDKSKQDLPVKISRVDVESRYYSLDDRLEALKRDYPNFQAIGQSHLLYTLFTLDKNSLNSPALIISKDGLFQSPLIDSEAFPLMALMGQKASLLPSLTLSDHQSLFRLSLNQANPTPILSSQILEEV